MNQQKVRHGCLTIWLGFLLIANSSVVLIYTLYNSTLRKLYPTTPAWAFSVLTLCGVLNIIFLIALLRWKKWGFWGSVGTYVLSFTVNLLLGISFIQAFLGLSGLVVLFGTLQIGKENKGWSQLE